jgi:hypothetical protein
VSELASEAHVGCMARLEADVSALQTASAVSSLSEWNSVIVSLRMVRFDNHPFSDFKCYDEATRNSM